MSDDRLNDLVGSGDIASLIGASLRAHLDAADGVFCECEHPILSGERLMCGRCLRSHEGQRQERERNMAGPHPFRWSPLDKEKHEERVARKGPEWDRLAMCRFCAGWREDPRHDDQGEEMWGIS